MRATVLVLLLVGLLFVGMFRPSAAAGVPQVSVSTDKEVYAGGEVVQISILLTNVWDGPLTLHFLTTCPATYDVVDKTGRVWYTESWHVMCGQALNDLTLAPGPGPVYRLAWNQMDDYGRLVPVPSEFTIRGRIQSTEPVPPGTANIAIKQAVTTLPTTPPAPPAAPTPPRASFFLFPRTGDVNTVFRVDASSSLDQRDPMSVLEVRWDWDGDGVWDTAWSTAKMAQHRYASPGTYEIRLQVRNTAGLVDTATETVQITSSGPVTFGSDTPLSPWGFPTAFLAGAVAAIALGLAGALLLRQRGRTRAPPPLP